MSSIKLAFFIILLLVQTSVLKETSAAQTPPHRQRVAGAQKDSNILAPNIPRSFAIAPGGSTDFSLELDTDQAIEINWLASSELPLSFFLFGPDGKNLLENFPEIEDSIPFVAREKGAYRLQMSLDKAENFTGDQKITLEYTDKYRLPINAVLKSSRKINGYDVKILQTPGDESHSFLAIEKGGRLKTVFKVITSGLGSLYFSDDLSHSYDLKDKASAALIKAVVDKTGDGTPDVMIERFTGGAHCCYETFFFELAADKVQPVEALYTADSRLLAVGQTSSAADGGLKLKVYDMTFSYWLTSFAGSPSPEVILEFKNERWRPVLAQMSKPAPSLLALRKKAAAAKLKIDREPYLNPEDSSFEEAFWGEMLDLLYTGHNDLAWQYFDLVWPLGKQGKEKFLADFKSTLSESRYWQLMEKEKNDSFAK